MAATTFFWLTSYLPLYAHTLVLHGRGEALLLHIPSRLSRMLKKAVLAFSTPEAENAITGFLTFSMTLRH